MLSYFKRHTNSTKLIPEIDGLRFFAIITVVLMHARTNIFKRFPYMEEAISGSGIDRVLAEGGLGVSVFFSISGFILAIPFARYYMGMGKKVQIGSYFLRRLTRLEPPYVVSLLIFFFGLLATNAFGIREGIEHFLASLFYVHYLVYGEWSTINPVTWSLETEVQFYILAPLFSLVFAWKIPWLRRTAIVGGIFLSSFHFGLTDVFILDMHLAKSIVVYLQHFLTGLLFADLFLSRPVFFQSKNYLWDLAGLASFALLFVFYQNPFHHWDSLVFCFLTFLIMISVFKGRLLNAFHRLDWVVVIGGMCYSIYLLHYGILHFFTKVTGVLNSGNAIVDFTLQMIVCVVAVLVISGVFFILIERPTMKQDWVVRLKSRILRRNSPGHIN